MSQIDMKLKSGGFGKTEQSPDERKRLRKRRWRRIAGVLTVLAIAFVIFRVYGRLVVNREIEKLRAKGYPVTFAELETYNRLSEGVPNAAEIYVKAFESYQAVTEEEKKVVPDLGSAFQEPAEFNTDETKAALAAFLGRNTRTLELLHEAGRIEQCRYEYPLKVNQGFVFPFFDEMKKCAILLRQDSHVKMGEGKIEESCERTQNVIRLGESLKTDPILISYGVRLALDLIAVGDLQKIFSEGPLRPDQYSEIAAQIRLVQQNLQVNSTLVGERIFQISDSNPLGKLHLKYTIARYVGLRDYNILCFFHYLEQYEQANVLIPARRWGEYKRILEEADRMSVFYYFTQGTIRKLDAFFTIDLRVGAQLDNAVAAIAVERYRLSRERLPESLRDLVPEYLEKTPIDPFDGMPLRYKRLEKGYTIYTIGEDGEDNGGVPKGKVEKGANYNWPFTVER